MKKLNIIGLGYIGLPTALSFAGAGIDVIGTDYNKKIVNTLNNGQVTFKEDGLYDLYKEALNRGIEFATEYAKTNKYIITVPTPYIKESKKLDPKYVISAVENVLDVCDKGTILVIESTVSPGTMDKFVRPIVEDRGFIIGEDIHLVHAPERIIPGNMVNELKNNSRTIGADNIEIGYEVKRWYETFCEGEIVVTDIKTAELSKVVENTFRDINIAFANELSRICRKEKMDVYELIKIANKHPRVNILTPGPGVGGHCISVDPWFLVGDYPEIVNIIKAAREVNDSQPDFVIDRIREVMNENGITDISKVGLYGLTYKENVDDLRESPTLQILEKLERYFVKGIKLYDPWIEEKKFENQYNNFNEFLDNVELVVVLVAHDHIKEFKEMINGKLVLDTKNIFEKKDGIYKL